MGGWTSKKDPQEETWATAPLFACRSFPGGSLIHLFHRSLHLSSPEIQSAASCDEAPKDPPTSCSLPTVNEDGLSLGSCCPHTLLYHYSVCGEYKRSVGRKNKRKCILNSLPVNIIIFHIKREPTLRIREPDEKREGTEAHNWEIDAYLMEGKQRPGARPRGNHCIIDNRMDTESKRCPGALIKKMLVQPPQHPSTS